MGVVAAVIERRLDAAVDSKIAQEPCRCFDDSSNLSCLEDYSLAKHSTDILSWARRGAEARWQELQTEAAALLKQFPHLKSMSSTAQRAIGSAARGVADTIDPPRRRRAKMSAAQRKAVSARMKKYWAARRSATK